MEPNQPQKPLGINPQKRDARRSAITIMTIAAICIIVLIIALAARKPKANVEDTATTTPQTHATSSVEGAATTTTKTVTVSLTDTGYSPATVTISEGDTVLFVNKSSGRMWTASDPYPSNNGYPGFDEKTAAISGESYSFTFMKPGTWPYHNQLNNAQKGTVVVEQIPGKD